MKKILYLSSLLTFGLSMNLNAANYSAYIPLDTIKSETPESILPPISQEIIMDIWSGQSISGSHPYVNSLNVSYGDNALIYNINAKTRLNFSITDNEIYGYQLLAKINNQTCVKAGSSYNCQFILVGTPHLDQGGITINDAIEGANGDPTANYDQMFLKIKIQN